MFRAAIYSHSSTAVYNDIIGLLLRSNNSLVFQNRNKRSYEFKTK